MELQFEKRDVSCLRFVLSQVQNLEQTQEVRTPEGMPGVARILSGWGQVILRSKEWQGDTVRLTGGVMVWVLYEPEEGPGVGCLDSWIPFRMDFDLPDQSPEGRIRARPLLRFVDARSVSAGKVLIRAGIGMLAECWADHRTQVSVSPEVPGDVELLRASWPLQLPKETGEKTFELEEELALPQSLPGLKKLLYYRMEPEVSDRRVMGNRIVFRGNGNLHILYLGEDDGLHSWDFELPFSQYAELEQGFSADARADVMMALTRLELEGDEEGRLHLKAGLTGQYLVDDRELVETVEDAYSPRRELTARREALSLPVLLDSRRENLYGEQTLPIAADVVADAAFLPDYPRQRREGDTLTLEQPGMLQLLYYDTQGRLQSAAHRWEGTTVLKAGEDAVVSAQPFRAEPQLLPGADTLTLRSEVPVQMTFSGGGALPMVTGLELGEEKAPDPKRPSLILRRAGKDRLWDIARESGSTVAAIRRANGLEAEPEPGKMLLIPVM